MPSFFLGILQRSGCRVQPDPTMATFTETGLVLKANPTAAREALQFPQELAPLHNSCVAQICASNLAGRSGAKPIQRARAESAKGERRS